MRDGQDEFLSYKKRSSLMSIYEKVARYSLNHFERQKYKAMVSKYNFNGFDRVYLLHIRKTAGTSLNLMFLSLAHEDSYDLYRKISASVQRRIEVKGKVFVGHNVRLINQGFYFYAYSHTPANKLNLPINTFTVTCFRDPVKRVVSLYQLLMQVQREYPSHPLLKEEGLWLGSSFTEFLNRVPREHLLNQLYMFSEDFDIPNAVEKVQEVDHIMFVETFVHDVEVLNQRIGLRLRPIHIRKTEYKEVPSGSSLKTLRKMLEPEYELLAHIRSNLKAQ